MASRSPRVFSAQFHLLLVTSQLEEAEERHRQAEVEGHRFRAWRASRELERLWDAVESQRRLLEPPAWRVADPRRSRTGLEPAELLHSRLQSYVHFEPRPEGLVPIPAIPVPVVLFPAPPGVTAVEELGEPSSWTPRLQELFAVGTLISIAVSAVEIALDGIGQRPGLIAAELCALAFAPFAILLGTDR